MPRRNLEYARLRKELRESIERELGRSTSKRIPKCKWHGLTCTDFQVRAFAKMRYKGHEFVENIMIPIEHYGDGHLERAVEQAGRLIGQRSVRESESEWRRQRRLGRMRNNNDD